MNSKESLNQQLHSIIEDVRKNKKLSLKKLGDAINYSDVGFMQALKARRLRHDDIIILGKNFGFTEELQEAGLKIKKGNDLSGKFVDSDSIEYLELQVMRNIDELLERPFLKSKINELVNKQIILTLPKIVVDLHKEWEEKNK